MILYLFLFVISDCFKSVNAITWVYRSILEVLFPGFSYICILQRQYHLLIFYYTNQIIVIYTQNKRLVIKIVLNIEIVQSFELGRFIISWTFFSHYWNFISLTFKVIMEISIQQHITIKQRHLLPISFVLTCTFLFNF